MAQVVGVPVHEMMPVFQLHPFVTLHWLCVAMLLQLPADGPVQVVHVQPYRPEQAVDVVCAAHVCVPVHEPELFQ
jgi:hypothetical protein